MLEKQMNRFIYAIEVAVSIALVAVAALLVVSLGTQLFEVIAGRAAFGREEFTRIISTALEVFIAIELFRIALAYMQHRNVIPTVFEAALVAIARKFVVFEPEVNFLEQAIGLAALLLAIAISWWALKRSGMFSERDEGESQ